MKMMAVPFTENKESFGTYYGIPGGPHNAFYAVIECDVNSKTTADDLFKIYDKAIKAADDDDDEHFKLECIISHRDRVNGFALVKSEIVDMLDDVRADSFSHDADEGIAQFKVAFCVKHADRLVMV